MLIFCSTTLNLRVESGEIDTYIGANTTTNEILLAGSKENIS